MSEAISVDPKWPLKDNKASLSFPRLCPTFYSLRLLRSARGAQTCRWVSDIRARFPRARIDWVVEEAYCAIVGMHPGRAPGDSGGAAALARKRFSTVALPPKFGQLRHALSRHALWTV